MKMLTTYGIDPVWGNGSAHHHPGTGADLTMHGIVTVLLAVSAARLLGASFCFNSASQPRSGVGL
jgi:hypothetical protein